MRLDAAVRPPAVGEVAGEIGPPDHARIAHAEAIEHAPLHLGAEIEPQPALQHELEQDHPFARIGVARARIEVEFEPTVRLDKGEIGEARPVREQDARRQPAPALVAGEMVPGRIGLLLGLAIAGEWPRQVIGDRAVEIEHAFVHQLHHRISEYRLGQRRAVHHRVGFERRAGRVAVAPGADESDLAVVDDGEGEPARLGASHRGPDHGLDRRRRRALGEGRTGEGRGKRQQDCACHATFVA